MEISGQHKQAFSYDNLDRVSDITEYINAKTFHRGYEYDALGRVKKEIYPSGFYTVNHYDANGYLTKITDRQSRLVWEAMAENARGQLTQEKKGAKITTYSYDERGLPSFISASGVLNTLYEFNEKGNLTYRDDYTQSNPQSESFAYDTHNRLVGWTINGSTTHSIAYNSSTGNIQTKSDIGNYTMNYGENGKPHALTSISGVPTNFPTNELDVTYTDFKKIKTLTEGDKYYQLTYGIDDQRRMSVYKENNVSKETRYYLGNYEEKTNHTNGITEKIHYLSGAIYIERSNGTSSFYYTYTDYLGSLIALTDESGTVVERYAYDPWGKRRNPANWTQDDSRTTWLVNRGYTGHEHIDRFGIINMNGRVYDPLTAMFFSPDPFVQAPDNWLNYNRYTYAYNNPFKYTDPDGEWIWIAVGAVVGGVINWGMHGFQWNMDGLAAFGIGAVGGVLAVATGGAILASYGTAAGAGGFIAGSMAASGAYSGTLLTQMGNAMYFGDPMPTPTEQAINVGITMLAGGVFNGTAALLNNRNFWTGNLIPKSTITVPPVNIPEPTIGKAPDLQKVVNEKFPTKVLDVPEVTAPPTPSSNPTPLKGRTFQAIKGIDGKVTYVGKDVMRGNFSVYQGMDAAGNVRYVGTTSREPTLRFAEHAMSGSVRSPLDYRVIDGATRLSKIDARIWEQTLINKYGLGTNGGQLFNRINSISPINWWQYSIIP